MKATVDDDSTTHQKNKLEEKRFDYVIVGAGPSGIGVLLGLLESLEGSFSIAVVERGGSVPAPETLDLRQWYVAAHPGRENRSVFPVATTITGRKMDLPRGQGLGGSSNINAGIVMPPHSQDYSSWPEPWRSSLPDTIDSIWKRLENHGMLHRRQESLESMLPSTCSGTNGWHIDWGASSATLAVEQRANGDEIKSTWERRNYFQALIEPLLASHPRCQLEWILDTQVQRLLVHGAGTDKTVHGVECYTRNTDNPVDDDTATFWSLYVSRAVILCAGAVESPALLLTSGLGPESSHLQFQGVGRHLKDQWLVPRTYLTSWQPAIGEHELSKNGISSLGHLTNETTGEATFQVAVTDWISHETIMPSTLALAIRSSCQSTFYARMVDMVFEVIKNILRLLVKWSPLGFFLRHFTRTTLICLMHPRSEGVVSIEPKFAASLSPHMEGERSNRCRRRKDVTVRVDVGYCRDPRDIDAMSRAWTGLKPPIEESVEVFPRWVFPPRLFYFLRIDWFPVFCRYFSQPYFHYSGTCSMKRNDKHLDWVVDTDLLKLRDHRGIHICDASVFPSMVSSPPALTCCALGYAFSKALISTSGLDVDKNEQTCNVRKAASEQ